MKQTLPASRTVDLFLEPLSAAVLHTILYFDIFRHPLNVDEIHRNCQWHACSLSQCAAALEDLQQKEIVQESQGYWFITGHASYIRLRSEREERAIRFMQKAKRYSKLIATFPFVRGVYISGSLSKGTVDKNGDIDYFIITQPGRLWIARTFLVLFKKVFLLNSRKYFCVNYFIDTEQLTIPDRNLFVATEIAFIYPVSNGELYKNFIDSNHWVKLFYPNRQAYPVDAVPAERRTVVKRFLERILNGRFGEWLDEKFLRLTLNRWKKKFPHVASSDFEMDFRSRRHVSKHHPQGFQRRVSAELEKRRQLISENSGWQIPALNWEWSSEKEEKN